MTAEKEYERIWDMLIDLHRRTHGENHQPRPGDFNCCAEYGVMMGLRAASAVKPDYPSHLLLRVASLPELDREFYVANVLATDGEAEPADPRLSREYRATRRHYILWNELKQASARVGELERELARLKGDLEARSA